MTRIRDALIPLIPTSQEGTRNGERGLREKGVKELDKQIQRRERREMIKMIDIIFHYAKQRGEAPLKRDEQAGKRG